MECLMRISALSQPRIESLENINDLINNEGNPEYKDSFHKDSTTHNFLNKAIVRHVKKIHKKHEPQSLRAPRGGPLALCAEEKFLYNSNSRSYFRLARDFDDVMVDAHQRKFKNMEQFLINPIFDNTLIEPEQEQKKLEQWHEKKVKKFDKSSTKIIKQNNKRNDAITKNGLGFGGHMSTAIGDTKAASFYTKNHLTIRGQVFRLNNELCGKNIYEMLPRYSSRKKQHMAVRITQFGINSIVVATGYSLIPVTFGVSSIVSTHAQTLVTLSGEVIALKLDGASYEKIASHAALRGVQIEIPKCVPFAGSVVDYGEAIMMGTAAFGIVSTTLADWIMQSMSDRYQSVLTLDDLGDPQVLEEMNERIDYLSRFLLPMGEKLLMSEKNPEHQEKLKKLIKKYNKILISLEHKKTKALNFYQLALLAHKIPPSHRELIVEHCKKNTPDTRVNTHKIAQRCLATLIAMEPTSGVEPLTY